MERMTDRPTKGTTVHPSIFLGSASSRERSNRLTHATHSLDRQSLDRQSHDRMGVPLILPSYPFTSDWKPRRQCGEVSPVKKLAKPYAPTAN